MKEQDQIKALAELDGHYAIDLALKKSVVPGRMWPTDIPNYLTSYDAIIPLIQKRNRWSEVIYRYRYSPDAPTPAQLCEALLRATGKWKD